MKTREGSKQPDRNAQFEHLAAEVSKRQAAGQPVISVDAKKRELVGDFKNAGQTWLLKGKPEAVRVYDFKDPELGHARPYGIYDISRNEDLVSVGIDHDTAAFAVESIRRWWNEMGKFNYPDATQLFRRSPAGQPGSLLSSGQASDVLYRG